MTEEDPNLDSAINMLAQTLELRDRVTHDHCRRVQTYAVTLARQLGDGDRSLVEAVDAAALLHDFGTIVISDYVLFKPGKLSVDEVETMKLMRPSEPGFSVQPVSRLLLRRLCATITRTGMAPDTLTD
jgi:two-component system response regulator RpfG